MTQTLGDTREDMAWAVWRKAEEIANDHKKEVKPFYIIYAAKPDPALKGAIVNGLVASGGIRQTFRLSYERPPAMLGILVWYVDNAQGIFEFQPHLSAPHDVPVHPSLLSDRSEDQSTAVMEKGKKLNVLVS